MKSTCAFKLHLIFKTLKLHFLNHYSWAESHVHHLLPREGIFIFLKGDFNVTPGEIFKDDQAFLTLATWCKVQTHWTIPWCWDRLRAGGDRGDRGWGDWIASLPQWTWVWVNSGTWLVHYQPRDQCLISHVIRAISATWAVHGQARDQFNKIFQWSQIQNVCKQQSWPRNKSKQPRKF